MVNTEFKDRQKSIENCKKIIQQLFVLSDEWVRESCVKASLDISKYKEIFEKELSDLNVSNFLGSWFYCGRFLDEDVKTYAKEYVKNNTLSYLFNMATLKNGRTVHISSSENSEDKNIDLELSKMFESFVIGLSYGVIIPGIKKLKYYYNVNDQDLMVAVKNSLFVPRNKVNLVTKGITSGFNFDFSTALHYLCPQFENMIREKLKANYVSTCILKDGVWDEVGLSSLLDKPEMTQIFGEDYTFQAKKIFCNKGGSNLRNDIAHGIFEDTDEGSHFTIYAWYFVWKSIYDF